MDVTLRKASETDKAFLLSLRKSTMTAHLEAAGIFLSGPEHEARIADEFDAACIIEYSGQRAGLVKYRETESCIEILQLQVLPEYQGKGIGRNVAESLINQAIQCKKRLALAVLKANPARRLYERLGFRIVGEDEYELHMQFVE